MAGTVGVSKSQVSRATIEAGERLLDDLVGRDFSGLDLLAVWIDGIRLGPYHAIGAARVDDKGRNHVLGHLPEAQHDQTRSTLEAEAAQLQKHATWLERDWPSSAGSP